MIIDFLNNFNQEVTEAVEKQVITLPTKQDIINVFKTYYLFNNLIENRVDYGSFDVELKFKDDKEVIFEIEGGIDEASFDDYNSARGKANTYLNEMLQTIDSEIVGGLFDASDSEESVIQEANDDEDAELTFENDKGQVTFNGTSNADGYDEENKYDIGFAGTLTIKLK